MVAIQHHAAIIGKRGINDGVDDGLERGGGSRCTASLAGKRAVTVASDCIDNHTWVETKESAFFLSSFPSFHPSIHPSLLSSYQQTKPHTYRPSKPGGRKKRNPPPKLHRPYSTYITLGYTLKTPEKKQNHSKQCERTNERTDGSWTTLRRC